MNKTNFLHLEGDVDLPRAIQCHPASHAREMELQQRILTERTRFGRLSPRVRQELVLYPWMIASVYMNTPEVFSSEDLHLLLESNTVRFAVLIEGWHVFGRLIETTLYRDLESVERLVNYLVAKKRNGMLPLTSYLTHLHKDPNRWARVAEKVAPEERKSRLDDLRAQAVHEQHESAAASYFILATTRGQLTVSDEYCQLMESSEEYAYLTALLLSSRHAPAANWQEVIAAVKTPRWAFHILKANLAEDPTRLLSVLKMDPPWLVEYFATRQVGFDEMIQLYKESVAVAAAHPMIPDLHYWIKTQSQHVAPAERILVA